MLIESIEQERQRIKNEQKEGKRQCPRCFGTRHEPMLFRVPCKRCAGSWEVGRG